MNGDHWKRGSFLFETLFHSSRYEFRLSRYRRVKRKVIFLIVCHLRSCLDCTDPLSLFLSILEEYAFPGKKYRSLNPFVISFLRESMMKIFNICLRSFYAKQRRCFYVFDVANHFLAKLFDTYIFINQWKRFEDEIYFYEYGRCTILKNGSWFIISLYTSVSSYLLFKLDI